MFRRAASAIFSHVIRWRREPLIPALLLLLTGSLWGFMEIADEVMEKEAHYFDETVMLAMRTPGDTNDPLGPAWMEEMGRDFTALGGFAVLTLITLSVTGFLLFLGRKRVAGIALLAVIGGMAMTHFLKLGFDRPRPDLVPHGVVVTNASFPSGHTMMAAVVYLTLGVLFARSLPRRRLRIFVVSVSVLIALLVGVSRVYLGVHWPTDVLAGWTLGAAWALVCWLLAMKVDPVRNRDDAAP